jgi:anti-sigma B factor antagonist
LALFYICDETAASGMVRRADIALLVAGGEIDFSAGPVLRERLLATIQHGRHHLVIDLTEVTFIDSTAIGALVGAATSVQADGVGSVRVVCAPGNDRVMRIFDIGGVSNLIELHASRAQALAAVDEADRAVELHDVGRRSAGSPLDRELDSGSPTGDRAAAHPQPEVVQDIDRPHVEGAYATYRRYLFDEVA